MHLSQKLMQLYFDLVYNPVYDFTIAQTAPYQRLQRACVDKCEFGSSDRVLCVGVGTGNEILRILDRNAQVSIVAVDSSGGALRRAYRKVRERGKRVETLKMDAHRLDFASESFDKALCLHLMGFLADDREATREIVRVLKREGQFVITYPSGHGRPKLVAEMVHSIRRNLSSGNYARALREFLAPIAGGIAYLPAAFWVRPQQGFYSYQDLRALFDALMLRDYQIEEDRAYQDFIVYGRK